MCERSHQTTVKHEKIRTLRTFLLVLFTLVGSFRLALADETNGAASPPLPLPRFASLKSDRVNLREGPSKDHRTKFIYQRAGLPVEITAEFATWRRIRDSEGTEGWVLQALLSGRRTALVAPWGKNKLFDLHTKADASSPLSARLMPNVQASLKSCNGTWCRITGEGFDGYLQQEQLWGAYPNETFE